jgi:molybdate transport system substrate-binding protein
MRLPTLLLLLMLLPFSVRAGEVLVAVAANFAAPIELLARDFEHASGHRLRSALGASGALYAQIRHGAPFALMLSADSAIPQRLIEEGLGVPGTRFTYARGRLVLWSPDPQRVDGSDQVLRQGRFSRLAIAQPRTAPYGAAARQVLDRLNLTLTPGQTLLQGESISQTYQFVATGNADLGFVALSQVWRDGALRSGSGWIVPADLHAPIDQDAVLLARAREQPEALALLAFLRSEAARVRIAGFGYEVPADE